MTEILMKGVELPNGKDVINLTIDSDGCIIYYDGYGMIEQYVEVIQPHGRLIDADKHMRVLEKMSKDAVDDVQREAFTMAHMLICQAPTVLEANNVF